MTLRRTVAGAVAALVLLVAVDFQLFVSPTTNGPFASGLVIVLGNAYRGPRILQAGELASSNRQLLIASGPSCAAKSVPVMAAYAERGCFVPSPFTTRGEARYAARYARSHHLDRITVITTPDQVSRARFRFERCWSGQLAVVGVDTALRAVVERIPYEMAATLKAHLLQRDC